MFVPWILWRYKRNKLIYVQTNKIINNRNVVFIKDSMSIQINLQMHPDGRSEGLTMVIVDESSKLSILDSSGDFEEHKKVRGNGVANEEMMEWIT